MTLPLVSIAMPVRNCSRTVAAAVQSILNQTLRDWELIVIDDGSSDGTPDAVSRFKDPRVVFLADGQSRGLPSRLNEALVLARGRYFARMDGDDVSYPRRLEVQIAYLLDHPEVDLVGTSMLVFGSEGRVVGKRMMPETHSEICRRPYSGFPMAHPTFLGKLDWFRAWLFELDAGGACDQDLLLRSSSRSRLANVPVLLFGYREDAVSLRKCLAYRTAFARQLVTHYGPKRPDAVAWGIAQVAMKSAVDALAVSLRLHRVLLRHRAMPVGESDAAEWLQVWQATAQEL